MISRDFLRFVNKPGPSVSMMMNNIGMIKIPNNVAVVIPATTVIPMVVLAPEPAPVDNANGNTQDKRKGCHQIGRKRIFDSFDSGINNVHTTFVYGS